MTLQIVRDSSGRLVAADPQEAKAFGWQPIGVPTYPKTDETAEEKHLRESVASGQAGTFVHGEKVMLIKERVVESEPEVAKVPETQKKPETPRDVQRQAQFDTLMSQAVTSGATATVSDTQRMRGRQTPDIVLLPHEYQERQRLKAEQEKVYREVAISPAISVVYGVLNPLTPVRLALSPDREQTKKQIFGERVQLTKSLEELGAVGSAKHVLKSQMDYYAQATFFAGLYSIPVVGGLTAVAVGQHKLTQRMTQGYVPPEEAFAYLTMVGAGALKTHYDVKNIMTQPKTIKVYYEDTEAIVGRERITTGTTLDSQAGERLLLTTDKSGKPANIILRQIETPYGVSRKIIAFKTGVDISQIPMQDLISDKIYYRASVSSLGRANIQTISTMNQVWGKFDVGTYSLTTTQTIGNMPYVKTTDIGLRVPEKVGFDIYAPSGKKSSWEAFVKADELRRGNALKQIWQTKGVERTLSEKITSGLYDDIQNVPQYQLAHNLDRLMLLQSQEHAVNVKIAPISLKPVSKSDTITAFSLDTKQSSKLFPLVTLKRGQLQKERVESSSMVALSYKVKPIQEIREEQKRKTIIDTRQDSFITPMMAQRQMSVQLTKQLQKEQLQMANLSYVTTTKTSKGVSLANKTRLTFDVAGGFRNPFSTSPKKRLFKRRVSKKKRKRGDRRLLPTADLLSIEKSTSKFGKATFIRSKRGVKEFRRRMRTQGVFMTFPTKELSKFKTKKFKVRL